MNKKKYLFGLITISKIRVAEKLDSLKTNNYKLINFKIKEFSITITWRTSITIEK